MGWLKKLYIYTRCKKYYTKQNQQIEYAYKNGCGLTSDKVGFVAAEYGNFECLKFAHENGCELTRKICDIATKNKHWNCVSYIHKNNCPCSCPR